LYLEGKFFIKSSIATLFDKDKLLKLTTKNELKALHDQYNNESNLRNEDSIEFDKFSKQKTDLGLEDYENIDSIITNDEMGLLSEERSITFDFDYSQKPLFGHRKHEKLDIGYIKLLKMRIFLKERQVT